MWSHSAGEVKKMIVDKCQSYCGHEWGWEKPLSLSSQQFIHPWKADVFTLTTVFPPTVMKTSRKTQTARGHVRSLCKLDSINLSINISDLKKSDTAWGAKLHQRLLVCFCYFAVSTGETYAVADALLILILFFKNWMYQSSTVGTNWFRFIKFSSQSNSKELRLACCW